MKSSSSDSVFGPLQCHFLGSTLFMSSITCKTDSWCRYRATEVHQDPPVLKCHLLVPHIEFKTIKSSFIPNLTISPSGTGWKQPLFFFNTERGWFGKSQQLYANPIEYKGIHFLNHAEDCKLLGPSSPVRILLCVLQVPVWNGLPQVLVMIGF